MYPNQSTKRGVKKADSAVPPMPAPKTPVANPRRDGSNHAFTNGIPTANVVPAMPRKNPNTSSRPYESRFPANATSSTKGVASSISTGNISRPP